MEDGLGWVVVLIAAFIWTLCIYSEGINEGKQRVLIEYNLGGYDEKTGEFIEYKKEELKDDPNFVHYLRATSCKPIYAFYLYKGVYCGD